MKLLLYLAICLWPLYGQVAVQYSPEPMAVLQGLNVTSIGLWSIRICNDGGAAVTVPPERLYMAAPSIRLITPERAKVVVLTSVGKSKKARAAQYIGYGLIVATALTGFGPVAANTQVVAGLAMGASLAGQLQQKFTGSAPDFTPFFSDVLTSPVSLTPGACTTKTAFAAKMKNAQAVSVTIK